MAAGLPRSRCGVSCDGLGFGGEIGCQGRLGSPVDRKDLGPLHAVGIIPEAIAVDCWIQQLLDDRTERLRPRVYSGTARDPLNAAPIRAFSSPSSI